MIKIFKFQMNQQLDKLLPKSVKRTTSEFKRLATQHTKHYVFDCIEDFNLKLQNHRRLMVTSFLSYAISAYQGYYGSFGDEVAEKLLIQDYLSSANLCYDKSRTNNSF